MSRVFSKIWIIGILVVVFTGGFFVWQKRQSIETVSASSVWFLPGAVWSQPDSHTAIGELQKCESDSNSKFLNSCVVPIMEKYKAKKEAIEFFKKSNYWFMTDFQEKGNVDLAEISTPWRANDNTQLALVNGSPNIIYIEEGAGKFSEKLADFNKVADTFPEYSFWPGDYSYMRQEGESFLFRFDLKNGCHACSTGYWAIISFDFRNGDYISPKFLDFCIDEDIKDKRFLTCSQLNETADWQTYRNEQYGFGIKYPQGWETTAIPYGIEIKNKESRSLFSIIQNKNPKNITLDEWFKETTIIDGRPTIKRAARQVVINGVKAYRLDGQLESPNSLFEIVAIADNKGNIFSILAQYEKTEDKDILNQILSTFRFF